MSEVDYQMALLLQYKLEQDNKRQDSSDSDHKLALELQEQFKAELDVERPQNNLVYKSRPALNNSKCLVDPSWEVIDPTPDVHMLFIAFNERFFWNTLGSVTVSWSKRMTTCAGICSYQGRGGLCSITLSEPLLKLRPRKDLVETLLHEMIHAHLFVTNNNRDRDGHGPEFHKHMYRINAEAGTNITVYHDFHDEVRLYQQHWWRCDGPCQQRKPYFGMVRRATNRAPGPNDRWWGEHSRSCGGTFVKVKSPEKPAKESKTSSNKKTDTTKKTNPKNDIRNYIPSTAKSPLPPDSKPKNTKTKNNITNTLPKNIHTVSNNSASTPKVSNVIPSKTSNIFGFTNLNGTCSAPKKPGVKGAIKNAGSSTFIVTDKKSSKTCSSTNENEIASVSIQPFSGTGRSLSQSSSSEHNGDYATVRDHWLKKFDNNAPKKRPGSSFPSESPKKVKKISICECPVCKKELNSKELNEHLDTCLENSSKEKECIICGIKISITDFERHVTECTDKHFGDGFEDDEVEFIELTTCPICSKKFDSKSEPKHIEKCKLTNKVDLTTDDNTKNCPVCKAKLSSKDYGVHVQNCILSMCDEFDKKCDELQNFKTLCLACNKEILKTELDGHLEDCMSMSNVFDTSNVPVIEDEEGNDKESRKSNYNCPFCLRLVTENEMQAHLDQCLGSNCDNDKEKSLLVLSLYESDSDME